MGNQASISFADRELATASEKGNLPRVKFLIEKDGADVNFQDQFGWSAFLHAVSEGHLDVMKFLLSKGSSSTHITSDRANAIHHAITSQNESVLLFLLQYGTCDVNGRNEGGWTPLHLACLGDDYSAAKLLLAYKADTTIRNGEGKTAIDIAISPNIKTLIERGPTPGDEISQEGELNKSKGMQKSLQQLQTLQNPPKAPLEMKGYVYLNDNHDSADDLPTIVTSSNYGNNENNNNMRKSGLVEREYQRIFDSIGVLRGIDPDDLNMAQVKELIDFHQGQLNKFLEARKIMEEIRSKELDLLAAE